MESSSENSFAWTDASNDSNDSSEMTVNSMHTNQSDNESEYGKSYKKKLQKELFAHTEDNNDNQINPKSKKRKLSNEEVEDKNNKSYKKKKIKLEPESDVETARIKRIYKESDRNGLGANLNDSVSNDDSYLNLRVKEEMAFKVPSPTMTKKKKKIKDVDPHDNGDTELSDLTLSPKPINNNTLDENQSDISEIRYSDDSKTKQKKKKKKTSKRKDFSEDESEADYINVQDKFSAEETVVETRHINKSDQYSSSGDQLVENKNYFQNKSDNWNLQESNYVVNDEIVKRKVSKSDRVDSEIMSGIDKLQVQQCDLQTLCNVPASTVPRRSRLSDRIRFEDEDNRDNNENAHLRSRQWEKFVTSNNNLKLITSRLKHNSILTQDDEIWIVHCPHNINVNAFQGITIPLDKKCKLKVEDSTYEGHFEDHSETITVLSEVNSMFVLKNLPSKGIISFRKRLPKIHIPDEIMLNNLTDFIPLPETKVRHPLFGSNYKKAIKISGAVKERLELNFNVSVEKKKVNKLKKKVKNSEDNDTVLNIVTKCETLANLEVRKKSKKHKHIDSDEPEMVLKPAKQHRQNANSAEVWDSEKAIEENLFSF